VTELRTPLRALLEEPLGDAEAQRLWTEARERKDRSQRAALRAAPWVGAAHGVAAAVAVLGAASWLTRDRGPLALADGRELAVLEAQRGHAAPPADLADGSSIALSGDARLEPLENSGTVLSLRLSSGHADVHVQKGGPRRWTIDCGPATVEVKGTRFALDRSRERLRVDVAEGVVRVRGEHVPDHERMLAAGEGLEVPDTTAAAIDAPVPAPSPAPSTGPSSPPSPASPAAPSWATLAREKKFADAYEALAREGGVAAETRRAGVDELFVLADVARSSGHPAEAIAPLSRIVDEHPEAPGASEAAFTLGKVLDALGRPAEAVAAYAKVRGALAQDAQARMLDAQARAAAKAQEGR
jgi:transmembrane sensor